MSEFVDCRTCKTNCVRNYGNYGYTFCDKYTPMTNADRIRAMSDEELAVWMTSIRLDILNELCKKCDVEIEMPVPTVKNTVEVREWLQQPTEGE